jgi:hypothetical protein
MRYIILVIVAVALFTACQKRNKPPNMATSEPTGLAPLNPSEKSPPGTQPIAAWGATKDEILMKLRQLGVRILTNTDALVVAEAGPEGLTDGNGKPVHVNHPLRTEFYFKDGKLASTKCLP